MKPCEAPAMPPLRGQLLKWIGNKQRVARQIAGHFPASFGTYYEPFLGSGAVLATLAPARGVGSDAFSPLVEIWQALRDDPARLAFWYRQRWAAIAALGKRPAYEAVKASYNAAPNGADLLFLSRACYGGVVRFRKADGFMSTPVGAHQPMHPDDFEQRVASWHARVQGCRFVHADYLEMMQEARPGDLVYCDPPYAHSQGILYGAQGFSLDRLLDAIDACKRRGVHVALSIDGTKKSGNVLCGLPLPAGLFERELFIELGGSMLKRFQLAEQSADAHRVADRLLLSY